MMSFFKKDDKERKKKQMESDGSMTSSDHTLNTDSEHIQNPTLSSSSKSSLDSNNQPQIILPPKPKKGILKTMSKFGQVNLTPKMYHKIDLIKNVPIAPQPPPPAAETPKSIESSIPTFSKRNSVFLNESLQISSQILPDLKSIPAYIIPENDQNDSILEPYLHRSVQIPIHALSQVNFSLSKRFVDEHQTESLNDLKNVPILVENVELKLYPGDQLMSLNDENILGKSFNEVKKTFSDSTSQMNSHDLIKFTVRTSLEYSDFILKEFHRSLSQHNERLRKKLSLEPNSPQPIDHSEISQVWLVSPNGYSSAKIFTKVIHKNSNTSLENLGSSNIPEIINFKVKLDNGKIIEVSEDSLEKSNPIQFDYCPDLSRLRFINETCLLHCLRQRYVTLNLNYTLIGNQNLLALGSNQDNKMAQMIKNLRQTDLPPHIYSQTQLVYKSMLANRQDQSIVLMGHSNSGKSSNLRLILSYLFKIAGSSTTAHFNGL